MVHKEKQNVFGNYSVDHSGVDAGWCDTKLAAQQELGLWPEWRTRFDIDHRDRSVADGTIVTSPIESWEDEYPVAATVFDVQQLRSQILNEGPSHEHESSGFKKY